MLIGQTIGPFAIDKELGSGAMGTVYRARHQESGQIVAIKIISAAMGTGEHAVKRFKRETDILRQLRHPNIVRLIASGRFHGSPFYAMEYVEGESMDHVLDRRGRISWEEVVGLGQQLRAALQHAHEKGIIHRDLKPSNLMLLGDGTLKLTDFGIAKDTDVTALTAANSTLGTASYMSPEQCKGLRELNLKADLYSLGIVFYELLTGRKPFIAETAMEMFKLHVHGTFQRPSWWVMEIPVWMDTLICQLMEKDPEQRPHNADAVARSLGEIKEKVQAQQSAGVDTAKRRRADRTAVQSRLDDSDKEVARTLLGKKSKKKHVPIYRRGWFTVTMVLTVFLALASVFYWVFIKPPSAASLFEQAQVLMKSENPDDRLEARKGPVAAFLEYYAEDPQAAQVQAWADAVDLEVCEKQMHKRRNADFKPADDAEAQARAALDAEDTGNLAEAWDAWQKLRKLRDEPNPDLRPWGLVADKYLNDLKAVDALDHALRQKIKDAKDPDQDLVGQSKAEKLAFKAAGTNARIHWEDLKNHAEKQPDERRWYLLAAKRIRELSEGKSEGRKVE